MVRDGHYPKVWIRTKVENANSKNIFLCHGQMVYVLDYEDYIVLACPIEVQDGQLPLQTTLEKLLPDYTEFTHLLHPDLALCHHSIIIQSYAVCVFFFFPGSCWFSLNKFRSIPLKTSSLWSLNSENFFIKWSMSMETLPSMILWDVSLRWADLFLV